MRAKKYELHEFDQWFKGKYGRLPNDKRRRRLGMIEHGVAWKLSDIRQDWKKECRIADEYNAALLGWTARKKLPLAPDKIALERRKK